MRMERNPKKGKAQNLSMKKRLFTCVIVLTLILSGVLMLLLSQDNKGISSMLVMTYLSGLIRNKINT